MTNNTEPQYMTPGQAVSAYKAILKSGDTAWAKWVELGHFVVERTKIAAAKAGATRGTTYATHLQKALGQFLPIYQKLGGNGTLTYLMKCIAKLDEVEAFRNRLKGSESATEPPSHPQRLWMAFEASQMSSITFEDDGEPEPEEKAKDVKHGKAGHNREKDLLAEITALREQIARMDEMYAITNDATNDAGRIWRRLVDAVGHDRAIVLGGEIVTKLHATIRRLTDVDVDAVGAADA